MTTEPNDSRPVEERVADRIDTSHPSQRWPGWAATQLRRLGRLDRAGYRAVSGISTPWLDAPLRLVSGFANFSKPWLATAAVMAAVGGSRGRRAAAAGLASIAVTSLLVNQPMKLAGERLRPDRQLLGVPERRWVPMPLSTSFPSGHSASAAAFAVAVGHIIPRLRYPLAAAATVVAFSRVYTGVHYPGDVLAGVAVGSIIGRSTAGVALRICPAPHA
jgi:undecaprenyl-diphosphatase